MEPPERNERVCEGWSNTRDNPLDKSGTTGNDSRYLLGILNSRLWTFLFSKISSEIRGGFFRWKRQYLAPLPIRAIDSSTPTDTTLHSRMVSLVEQMLALHKQFADATTPHVKTAIRRRIDAHRPADRPARVRIVRADGRRNKNNRVEYNKNITVESYMIYC